MERRSRVRVVISVGLGVLCAALAHAGPMSVDPAAFDSVLAAYAHADGVDYRGLRERGLPTLSRYLDAMAGVDPSDLRGRERDAHEIDLYNATMLRAVCDRWRTGWTPAADSFAVFRAPLVRMKGRTVSLDQLENQILRPRLRDPRLHVALHCAARSCPPLASRAYRAATLDSALDANMAKFIRDRSRNSVDAKARRMRLSRLFDWYAADFGGAAAVPAYVARQLGLPTTGWSVEYLEYDWALASSDAGRPR